VTADLVGAGNRACACPFALILPRSAQACSLRPGEQESIHGTSLRTYSCWPGLRGNKTAERDLGVYDSCTHARHRYAGGLGFRGRPCGSRLQQLPALACWYPQRRVCMKAPNVILRVAERLTGRSPEPAPELSAVLDRAVKVASRGKTDARLLLDGLSAQVERARHRHGPVSASTMQARLVRAWVLIALHRPAEAADDVDAITPHLDAIGSKMRGFVLGMLCRADDDAPFDRRARLEKAWPRLSIDERVLVAHACMEDCEQTEDRAGAQAWLERGIETLTGGASLTPHNPYRDVQNLDAIAGRGDQLVLLVRAAVRFYDADGAFKTSYEVASRLIIAAQPRLSLMHRQILEVVLAQTEHHVGSHDAAIERLESLTTRRPVEVELVENWRRAHAALGAVLVDAGRPEDAASAAERALTGEAAGRRDSVE